MPMNHDEVKGTAPKLFAFGSYLVKAFGPESDGGRAVTKVEWRAIRKQLFGLGAALLVDALD